MSPPAVAMPVHFGLETPLPFAPAQNFFQLVGWAFIPGATQRTRVRIVVDERIFEPKELLERPDVAALHPDEPFAGQSGFKFLGYLPFGFYLGSLEVSADGVDWQRIRPLSIPVSSHPIMGAIEKPKADAVIRKPVRVEGWCYHPEFKVREIVLQFGNVEVPCEYGGERPDVAERFPNDPLARRAGFITTENLPRGSGQAKIRALTECGRVYYVGSELQIDIVDGFIPKPPPPSLLNDLSTAELTATEAEPPPPSAADLPLPTGGRNILFALYGDFTANSALHVASLANELIKLGYDCVAAVPDRRETLGALPRADFLSLNFADLPRLRSRFKDGLGPRVVHAWTSRENVRKFSEEVARLYGSAVFVHLEDNEQEILEARVERPFAELDRLSTEELDALIPEVLSHPHRARQFLAQAAGVTVIVEKLRSHIPPGRPAQLIWPAADAAHFHARPRHETLRTQLGFKPRDIVLFYHGNSHTSNAAEMRSLYEAVLLLNQRGLPTQLIRAGRDFPDFLPEGDDWIRPYLVHVGHIGRARRLPELMAMADYFVQPGLPGAFNDFRFPSKLPEFFAIGRPVILPHTNLGDLVRHGEHAWVLPKADASAIADAIAGLHADPKLVERLSAGALAFAQKHFSWPRSARQLLEFYRAHSSLGAPASS